MATFVNSQKGNQKLVHSGFLYRRKKEGQNGKRYWLCDLDKKEKCNGAAITDAENNVTVTRPHNHPPSPARSELAQIKNQIKQIAASSNVKARTLITEQLALAGVSEQVKASLPKFSSLEKMVSRKRCAANDGTNNNTSAADDNLWNNEFQLDFEFDSPEMVSAIWTCFSKTEIRGEAQCHYCSRILIQHQGSTKILWSHLKSNHKPEFAQLKQNQQVLVPSTSKAAANQSNNVDLNQFFAQNENPKMEVIKVKSTSKSNNKKRAKLSGNSYGGDFPSRGSSEVSSQADGRSTIPAVSHILVWSALSHEQNNPTYIMANLMDDGDDPLHSGYGELSISSVIHQKLGAVTEPSGCCFSTRMPANIVLNEFSNLGYRAIGMVNKRTDEVLWTLAKNN